MSSRTIPVTDAIYEYLTRSVLREPEILAKLRAETLKLAEAGMQISPEQGQFMRLLVELLGARRTLEVGVFTGYSSLAIALTLPDDGHIVACDVSEQWTQIARRYYQQAGVAHKIDLRIAPAERTLKQLIASGESKSFDFAFIDADKENVRTYYELCLELVRSGGLIAVDNALWSGKVADPHETDPGTTALRALNAQVTADERVSMSLIPIGDGLLLARKR